MTITLNITLTSLKLCIIVFIHLLFITCGINDWSSAPDGGLIKKLKESKVVIIKYSNSNENLEIFRSCKEFLLKLDRIDLQPLLDFFAPSLLEMKLERIAEGLAEKSSTGRAYYSDRSNILDMKRGDIEIMDGVGEQGSAVVISGIGSEKLQLFGLENTLFYKTSIELRPC